MKAQAERAKAVGVTVMVGEVVRVNAFGCGVLQNKTWGEVQFDKYELPAGLRAIHSADPSY